MLMIMFMLVLVVVMHVFVFFPAVDSHGHVCTGDAALYGRSVGKGHSRNSTGIQFLQKCIPVGKKLEKSSGEHISRSAHRTVDVQCFHDFASIWLIMLAR